MGRIFSGKTLLLREMSKKWEEVVPKIYKLAELENNPSNNFFIEDEEGSSEGSERATLPICVLTACLCCSS